MPESVKVMVRCRPPNKKEIQKNITKVVHVHENQLQVMRELSHTVKDMKSFTFDHVFDPQVPQSEVYEQSAFTLVEEVLNGFNGTLFAYGQTGCGKTYTMIGPTLSRGEVPNQQTIGIIPRAFHQIMTVINSQKEKNHLIQCSFIEIYNEDIHDLLSKDIHAKLALKESTERGLFIKDLKPKIVKSVSDLHRFLEMGNRNKVIRETSINAESSRSHCIFTIIIDQQENDAFGNQTFKSGKLNLIDLAGSERQSKMQMASKAMKESVKINLSLSALGNVISSLADGKGRNTHIPYRDSKLTRLLQDSLGGNTKTMMIATVSPCENSYQETLSTLRYASRAKYIENKPIINEDPKDVLLRQYASEIKRLKLILEGKISYFEYESNEFVPERITQMSKKERSIQGGENQNQNQEQGELREELKRKENLLELERQQRQKIAQQLQRLQGLLSKDDIDDENNEGEMEKINHLKKKLREQHLKEEQYQEEKKKREEELLNIEQNYKTLNDEVNEIMERYQELRTKYVQSVQELKDVRGEHEKEKEELLNSLRYEQAQHRKNRTILFKILDTSELDSINERCIWVQDSKEWAIPDFLYTHQGIVFPKPSYSKLSRISKLKDQTKSEKNMPPSSRFSRQNQQLEPAKGSYYSDISKKSLTNLFELQGQTKKKGFEKEVKQKLQLNSKQRSSIPNYLQITKQLALKGKHQKKMSEESPRIRQKLKEKKPQNKLEKGEGNETSNLYQLNADELKNDILKEIISSRRKNTK